MDILHMGMAWPYHFKDNETVNEFLCVQGQNLRVSPLQVG